MSISLGQLLDFPLKSSSSLLSSHGARLQSSVRPELLLPASRNAPAVQPTAILALPIAVPPIFVTLRAMAAPYFSAEYMETIAEDQDKTAIRVRIRPPTRISEGQFFSICMPKLELIDESPTICANVRELFLFADNEQLPSSFSLSYVTETSQRCLQAGKGKMALGICMKAWRRYGDKEELMYQTAFCYKSLGNWQEMLKITEKLLAVNPTALPAQLQMCEALICLNQFDDASVILSLIDGLHPSNSEAKSLSARLTALRDPLSIHTSILLGYLKKLTLVKWPENMGWADLKSALGNMQIAPDRVAINGQTATLLYSTVERREAARGKLETVKTGEFITANCPAD